MDLTDFQRRLLGFPAQMFGGAPGQPIQGQDVNTATLAAPTADQVQQQDMQQAGMQRLGQLGMLLMAAGQRMTPRERATILAQAPQYMDGVQRDAMTAAQARLMNMQGRVAQDELTRTEALRQKFNDPNYLKTIGLTPEQAQALGPSGIQKLLENQAMANTPDNVLDRQVKQAQLQKLLTPDVEKPMLVDMPDGSKGWSRPGSNEITPIANSGKPLTDQQTQDQANAALFSSRMQQADKIINDPNINRSGMGISGVMNRANASIPIIGNAFVDKEYQQLDQAKRNFINAVMRRESGAKIDPTEFENANIQYFPQVGDSAEVMKQKEANRKTAIQGIYNATSSQYRKNNPMPEDAAQNDVTEINGVKIRRIN